jgi:hypothetical protein
MSTDPHNAAQYPDTFSPSQAAKSLGLSKTRVLQMLKADPPELVGHQDEQGRWRIPVSHVETVRRSREQDRQRKPHDAPGSLGQDLSAPPQTGELVEALRDQIEYLQRQVEEEREARRRADTLLARLMDRVPELEAPQERQDAPQRPESPGPTDAPTDRPAGPQSGAQRPWWRRIIGQ